MSAHRPTDRKRLLEQAYGLSDSPGSAARPKRVEPRIYQPSPTPPAPQAAKTTLREKNEAVRLRLVGTEPDVQPAMSRPRQPIMQATDPRWVLAVRTSESMQGAILPPEARQRLMRLGHVMGLSPFDCSLVIAIVQDQARRGYAPADCPAAGVNQLSLIPPPPKTATFIAALKRINLWQLLTILGAAIIAELLVLRLIFG
ncbi:MAG: hypothetical protein IT445_01555 [Phycisphaeraceae bacterium]|nr:hypothetical protein [Phycisphaeraceae bacterium]